jgi:transposase-like protein
MIPEFKSILDLIKAFPTEQSCIDHLEKLRWDGFVISPFAPESKVYKCAGNKFKCKNTGKYFNVRTNTIFDNTKIPLQKWFLALYVFSSHKKGISSHQLAKDISVTQKTAWFLLHRLRYAFDHPKFQEAIGNVVEIDETFVGGKEGNKHYDKKYKQSDAKSKMWGKAPILGMIERGGNLIAIATTDVYKETLLPLVRRNVRPDSLVITDEYTAYNDLNDEYYRFTVQHSAKQYVSYMAHTNTIEGAWSHLKRTITGIYHWISKRHLQAYVNEFTLRYNTRKFATQNRFDLILSGVSGKRLTYEKLIN